ncbi:MAG TPA: isoprenylcysteine carboxylmethyltransferase family protein [Terriglobales bacterium]|nr:isoprenylcysteine carboxylmethyltransferase family protein [Terriglobales bacterium]
MKLTLSQIELFPWYVFLVYWTISALRVKQTKVTEEFGGRLLHIAIMVLACYLLFSERLGIGPLGSRFLPKEAYVQSVGVVLTYLGVALAVWARYSIGQYWSGRVTLKVDHQLIQSGLYGYMRHPIYTGILVAFAGKMLVVGRWRCVAGLLVAIFELSRKAAKEEALLASEFGSNYQQYRQRTGFLLPRFH